jgi:hypothetical protein
MSSVAYFGCDIMKAKGKTGTLKTDAKGYHQVVLGGLDYSNQHGQHYCKTKKLEEMLTPGTTLYRRLFKRRLFGEWGHPVLEPGETVPAFLNRFKTVAEKSTSHHIREVWLEEGKDEHGKPVTLIMAWVRPSGPYAASLADALANSEQDACFSIRSTSDRFQRNGRLEKEIKTIFTWDYVHEPGLEVAAKYNVPTLESLDDLLTEADKQDSGIYLETLTEHEFTAADLDKAEAVADHLAALVTAENAEQVTHSMIRTDMGWVKAEMVKASALNWGMQ